MERKETVKMEDPIQSTIFSDPHMGRNPFTGTLDFGEGDQKSSLGFMELLGFQDFSPSIYDILQVPVPSMDPTHSSTLLESSEVVNTPATPNSSSFSSASSGAPNDEQNKVVDEEEEAAAAAAAAADEDEQQKTKKILKPKKTSQGKQRVPRFAFMTKSEVDHLEDGYRWRKYGQKAVKNSPFPRSYYRCTSASCNVKKRVERSFSDPSIVVTTYEGQHTHPSPLMHRSSPAFFPPGSGVASSAFGLQQPQFNNCGYTNPSANSVHDRRFFTPAASAFLGDYGLLQDIVPSAMKKEE